MSLLALAAEPELWDKFHREGGLLLTSRDFASPARSDCIDALRNSPDHQVFALADRLQDYCSRPVDQVPNLESILRDIPAAVQSAAPPASRLETSPVAASPRTVPDPEASAPQAQPVPLTAPAAAAALAALEIPPEEPSSVEEPAPAPSEPVVAASAPAAMASSESLVDTSFPMSGRLLLGLIIAGFGFLLLTAVAKPALLVSMIVLSAVLCLLPIQAKSATRLPVAAMVGVGLVIYLFSVIRNGTLADPFSLTRDTTIENASSVFFGIGLVLVSIGLAFRLLGLTKEPEPTTALSEFIKRMGRYNRAGMVLPAIGIPVFVIGLAPQEIIDSFFFLPQGTDCFRAQGIRLEADTLYWPLVFLDKVGFIGGVCFWLGIVALLLGVPRRVLFAYILRRAYTMMAQDEKNKAAQAMADSKKVFNQRLSSIRAREDDEEDEIGNPVDQAYTVQFGLAMMTFGLLAFLLRDNVIQGFLIPAFLEFWAGLGGPGALAPIAFFIPQL